MMACRLSCLVLSVGLLGAAGCATFGGRAVKAPFGKGCLYAPIFVDNSEGQVAHHLYDALNQRIYRRAPSLFSYEYADHCAVIDGTVIAINESHEALSIEISAMLKDKSGNALALGTLTRSASVGGNRERTLATLCTELADDLLDAVSAAQ